MKRLACAAAWVLLAVWLGFLLHEWTDCKARGGQWLRSPFSTYTCMGAK
jgi:hypothetical protein